MNIQDKILAAIRERIQAAGLDDTVKASFANCGTIYAQRGFATLLEVRYDFQRDYCTLEMHGDPVIAFMKEYDILAFGGQSAANADGLLGFIWHAVRYNKGERIEKVLAVLDLLLPPQDPDRRAIPAEVSLNGARHEVVAAAYVPKRPGLLPAHVVVYRSGQTYNVHYLAYPSTGASYLHQGSYDLTHTQAMQEFTRRILLERKE